MKLKPLNIYDDIARIAAKSLSNNYKGAEQLWEYFLNKSNISISNVDYKNTSDIREKLMDAVLGEEAEIKLSHFDRKHILDLAADNTILSDLKEAKKFMMGFRVAGYTGQVTIDAYKNISLGISVLSKVISVYTAVYTKVQHEAFRVCKEIAKYGKVKTVSYRDIKDKKDDNKE
jgi:hypothetical protein